MSAATHPAAGDPRHWTHSRPSKAEVAKTIIAQTLAGSGYEDRISARALGDRTPVSVSTVRDLVSELRADGMPVISFGSGYFEIQTDDTFREAMARQERARQRARQTQQELAAAYYGNEPR